MLIDFALSTDSSVALKRTLKRVFQRYYRPFLKETVTTSSESAIYVKKPKTPNRNKKQN